MKKARKISECETCEMRGYSPELCKIHIQHLVHSKKTDNPSKSGWRYWGVKMAIGAGVGVTGAVAGMTVVPVFGVKAMLGHMMAVKVAGGGGAVGAGSNVALSIKNKGGTRPNKKKKQIRSYRLVRRGRHE